MYTKRELDIAARFISKVAHDNQVPEAQVRADILEAMDAGRNAPDPAVKARWIQFHYAGTEPTVEEFILWLAEMTSRAQG